MPDHTSDTADVAVIGAGILGLSTAMALATRHEGLRVIALEQEAGVGRHQSGNNSGVIHSGLYYRPGSAKARMALGAGRVATYDALLRQVWSGRSHANPKLVRAYVQRLRRKLGDDTGQPTYILTERRVGYRMRRPDKV